MISERGIGKNMAKNGRGLILSRPTPPTFTRNNEDTNEKHTS
jgi:hypothetical protein